MPDAGAPFFDPQPGAGAIWPSSILPGDLGKRVGQQRKKTPGNAPRRVVLIQPPHYGRVGAQITPPPRVSRAEHDAARAVQVAHFEREEQTRRHGARATVRPR